MLYTGPDYIHPDGSLDKKMMAEIDGARIVDEETFHREIAAALDFPGYYGENMNALWDVMCASIARPLRLVWRNAALSKQALGPGFEQIVDLLREVEKLDAAEGLDARFELVLQ